jgi:hypothetical protein
MSSRAIRHVCLALFSALLFAVPAQAATVTLAWNRNAEPDVQGYYVSYGTGTRSYTVEVSAGNNTSVTLTLNPNSTTTYFFAVQAFNANGRSAYSTEVTTTVVASTPILSIDLPGASAVTPSDILIAGWAVDTASPTGTGVDTLHVYIQPVGTTTPFFLGIASYGSARPDIGTAYGSRFTNSGWTLPAQGLTPGTYDLIVYAHSTFANAFNLQRTRRITISGNPPSTAGILQVDMPTTNTTVVGWLYLRGWAIDRRSTGTGPGIDVIQVMAYPNPGSGQLPWFLGYATYGGVRADVATAYGNARFRDSGFSMDIAGLPAGPYDIVMLARNTINSGWEVARVRRVNVDPAVRIAIDMPIENATASGTVWLSGWAIDRRSTSGIGIDGIHVYAYPASGAAPFLVAATVPSGARPDVASAYGSRFLNSGYIMPINGLAPGTYDLAVLAHSSVTNSFDNVVFRRVTVQ